LAFGSPRSCLSEALGVPAGSLAGVLECSGSRRVNITYPTPMNFTSSGLLNDPG